MFKFRSLICFVMLCLFSVRAAEVSAELSANSVGAGEAVMLTIQISGGSPKGAPSIPEVEDLIVKQRGRSQQVNIANGKVSRMISYSYVIGSMEEGEYEIPAATVMIDGEEFSTEPLKLTVRPSANGAPAGMGDDDASEAEASAGDYGYLTFQLATKDRANVYPGEIAPVKIKAFFPMDTQVSLNSPPRPEGSAFTLHNLTEEPHQAQEVVNGKRYRVVTWFGGLSATKAGKYPASFGLEARVGIRKEPTGSRRRLSPFGSLFGQVIEKDVELVTESPPVLEVTELPKEGRPDDFTGAIGVFDFESVRVPNELVVGEPFRVEAVLKGSGNFSLLREPHPLPVDEWKVYEGKSEFQAGDVASFAGAKRFQFNAVPLAPGRGELSFGFSYFDPEKGEYRTVESPSEKVVITGEAAVVEKIEEVMESAEAEPEGPQLAPLRTEIGSVGDYRTLAERSWFIPVIGGSLALSYGIFGLGWWMRRDVDHAKLARKASEASAQDAIGKAERAVIDGDSAGFFLAARNAIRVRVAEKTGVRPEAVTLVDLQGIDDPEIVEILNEADRIDYSGGSSVTNGLGEWKVKLDRGLGKLAENSGRNGK